MDPRQFCTASRVLIVAGKGGVGKTTVAAAMGVAASSLGIDTLIVEVEGKHGLASLFDVDPLGFDETRLIAAEPDNGIGGLRARAIASDDALASYFDEHGLAPFRRTLRKLRVLDTLATSTPGLRDLVVLGKIKQLETARDAELIIIDTPASGHAISFLQAARGLADAIDTGPIRRQADEAMAMLTDPERARTLLVTLAEETPINELVETGYTLEEEVGVALTPPVVNAVLPDWAAEVPTGTGLPPDVADAAREANRHWANRSAAQRALMTELAADLPLEQLRLPRLFRTRIDRSDLDRLATALLEQIAALRFADTA